jgi:hypothetical protein
MPPSHTQKAPFNDWWYWSECLVKRLRTMGDLYRENGEAERGDQALEWSRKLKDNCMTPVVAARKGLKTDAQKAEVKKLEEDAIFQCARMFRELLVNLPFMSSAIQDFLYVGWQDCKWEDPAEAEEIDEDTGLPIRKKKKKKSSGDSRVTELFWGPKARQDEGIRSGKVEDGGLPGILANLLAAEKTTSSRSPTEYGQAMLASVTQSGVSNMLNQAGPKPGGFP